MSVVTAVFSEDYVCFVVTLLGTLYLSAIIAVKVSLAMNEANLNAQSVQFSNILYAESSNYFVKLKNEIDKLKNEQDKLKKEQDKLKNIHKLITEGCSAKGSCSGLELFSTDPTRDDE